MATKNLSEYNAAKVPDASNMTFGIVVSEWNPDVTGALLEGCVNTLEKHGALPENIHVKTVPGSFELIYGARQLTLNDGYDAVIILGCVIRGETPHFDYLPGRHTGHCPSECYQQHSCGLRTADYREYATSIGSGWRTLRQQR